jgi:hypothetical protein
MPSFFTTMGTSMTRKLLLTAFVLAAAPISAAGAQAWNGF